MKYSILELASVAAGTTPKQTFDNSLTLAQQAERFGYHRFWLAEHHNTVSIASSATAVLIGYVAQGPERIRVGSGGIMLPNHSPLIVTENFATLSALYPGRIDLGLGRAPGTDKSTAHAIRPDRAHSVYNFPQEIAQIKKYCAPENCNASVRIPLAEGLRLPIYILCSSTDSAWLAAKQGLPYAFASHFAPAQLHEALSIYHNHFQPSAELAKPYTIACVNVIAADSDTAAEILSTSMLRMVLGLLTNKRDYLQAPSEFTQELKMLADNPAFQQFLKYAFVGGREQVKQKTQQFIEQTGVNELMVVSSVFHLKDRIRSFELFAEIMQELQVEATPF
jgi:luciferase family oxidoreductase group 1